MNRIHMPEVYEDAELFREQLQDPENEVLYCTPDVASLYVAKEHERTLYKGEAVRVSRGPDQLRVVPVEWKRNTETQMWDYFEVAEPVYAQLTE